MRELVLLRHGVTDWNREGRIQGRRDVPLSEAGRAALAARRLAPRWQAAQWHASPLVRARESALALGAAQVSSAGALVEMDWGEWEGARLAELRAALGEAMRANEARGLDFRPPGGESPREVRERVRGWVTSLEAAGPPVVAVTHKGVIRAALSLATGWDMREGFRTRPDWRQAFVFRREPGGGIALEAVNVPLEEGP